MPYLRTLIFCLIGLVLALQYALWFGKSNVVDLFHLKRSVTELEKENLSLRERNDRLHADVNEIKNRVEAIEERAREHLGLILPGETYFQVVPAENEEQHSGTD
ncbi:MAG TPA: cell division protein FtsB [Gammaproteobacteria bacterium]|nr:cell division protein FtsB [Acidiferrobacteraceae bacterium]MDP6552356.1 septum formation initiator family protein [Arenicellales bacterium]MDP6790357.1 septum formation initiator family protein [Arenicellales bacterium]MDP6918169.1 septum formation initiator family protein [Arenicellales bacterium]HCX87773.1 cell division protein FtsB [Gammaproteobacteria bacterium]